MKNFRVLLLSLFALTLALPLAAADVYMKQSVKTDSFQLMGRTQPAQEQTVEMWLTQDKMKSITPQQTVLFRLDQKKMYFINDMQKSYGEAPINIGEMADQVAAEQGEEMDEDEQQAFAQFFKGMTQMSITVAETNETKKIGSWNCKKYIQTVSSAMGPITSEVWTTEDLNVDASLFAQTNAAMLSMQTGGQDGAAATLKELQKIKGVPVMTVTTTNMMGAAIRSSTSLVECTDKKAPAGTFEVPQGYKKSQFMGAMQS